MRKVLILLVALCLLTSVSFIGQIRASSQPVDFTLVKLPVHPYQLSLWGDDIVICGWRHISEDGYDENITAVLVGTDTAGNFSIKYAPIPQNWEYVPAWPPLPDAGKECLATAKFGDDIYAFSTEHATILWRVEETKYDLSNIRGWGASDMAVFAGNLIGNVEAFLSVHTYKNGYNLITAPFDQYMSKHGVGLTPLIIPVIGDRLYVIGDYGYMVLDNHFHIVKSTYEEEWYPPLEEGQSVYDIYKDRYIIYATGFTSGIAIFDTKTGKVKFHHIPDKIDNLPAGPKFVAVTPSGIVYAVIENSEYKGKVVAFKFQQEDMGLSKLWERAFSQPIYGIDNHGETIYLAMGEDGLGILRPAISFSDVPRDYWAYNAIMALAAKGVINGYPDGTFRPEKGVTRAEFAKMLAVYMNLPTQCDPTLPEIKKDVKKDDWFCPYVSAVVKAGYMRGYGGGRFGPKDPVKKEEILTTLVRVKGYKLINPPVPTFPDVPKSHWAYPYIETAVHYGLVKKIDPHITDGKFHLGIPATRAQTAVFIYRAGE